MRLKCGCVTPFGVHCGRDATQEDLLCDECRDGKDRNAVMIYAGDAAHHHLDITNVKLSPFVS